MAEFSAEPIEPGGSRSAAVVELLSSWRALKLRGKVVIGLYAVLGAVGSLYASYVLVHEVHHWAAWAFALLVLDPVAVAALLCIAALVAPDSFLAGLLASAVRRAKIVALSFLVGYAAVVLGLIGFAAWQVVKD